MLKPENFEVGQILKFDPGYHTKEHYYAEVIEVGENFIKTSIPGMHELKIEYPSITWDYQANRIKILGTNKIYKYLIYDQKFKNKKMEAPNLGPTWLWILAAMMACVGFVSAIACTIYGFVWIFRHIHFV